MGDLSLLRSRLVDLDRVVVAFSGGADSSFLAWVARDTLGPQRVVAATAVSASLAADELEECRALAQEWDLRWVGLGTGELDDPAYVANDADRCYHCKSSLMDAIAPVVAEMDGAAVVLGVNLDDLGDHRPGQRAAAERGAVFPLVDAGFSKADLREASRVPYGTPVTLGILSSVAAAESALRRLGFRQLRVRHYGELARLEFELADLDRAVTEREAVVAAVREAGYRYVTLDLEGFRSGNLNRSSEPE
jgi:uncharacterized protein